MDVQKQGIFLVPNVVFEPAALQSPLDNTAAIANNFLFQVFEFLQRRFLKKKQNQTKINSRPQKVGARSNSLLFRQYNKARCSIAV